MKKIILLASVAFATTGFAQKVNNKLTFTKGQKMEVVTEIKRNMNLEVMGQSMETVSNVTFTESYDVQDATANSASIEHKVKRLLLDITGGMGGSQSFDSEKESDMNGEMGKMFKKSLKNKYTITVDPTGKITAVKADDDNPNAKKTEEDQAAQMVSGQLGLNMDLPKEGDLTVFKLLSEKEVGQGSSWIDSSSSTEGKKVMTNYTVSGITNTEILLDYSSTIDTHTTQQMMGQEATINLKDKVTGKVILDRKTGLLKQKTASAVSEGSIDAQGMSIPLSGKSNATITVKGV
jgi:hypothetical protein